MRPSQRAFDEMRSIEFIPHYTQHAEGSVLACFGHTKVLCTASFENRVPSFMRGEGRGWITAEYGMLPRSTHTRMGREAARGKQSGRTQEIQRLIGRSLRAAVDLNKLGENTLTIDCDVIQADGGTRTTAISGGFLALQFAIEKLLAEGVLKENPIIGNIAAISVGIHNGNVITDLEYIEDSEAETDMNVVMNAEGKFIEIQATAEAAAFAEDEFSKMLQFAKQSIHQIIDVQKSFFK